MKKVLYLTVVLMMYTGVGACTPGTREKTKLRVLIAGSLIVPFDEIERAFEEKHPCQPH